MERTTSETGKLREVGVLEIKWKYIMEEAISYVRGHENLEMWDI